MSDISWIRITTNIFDDEKIRLLETLPDSDSVIVIWFKLLVMAGKCNACGLVYLTKEIPYNEEMMSTVMRRPVNTIRMALNEFCRLGMIEVNNNYINIVNWEKHQNSIGLERIREQAKIRKQRQRQKQIECHGTSRDCHAPDKIRIDKNRIDKNNIRGKNAPEIPPTADQVNEFILQTNLSHLVDSYAFFHYYETRGWCLKDGKKMKNWHSAVHYWARNKFSDKPKKSLNDRVKELEEEDKRNGFNG